MSQNISNVSGKRNKFDCEVKDGDNIEEIHKKFKQQQKQQSVSMSINSTYFDQIDKLKNIYEKNEEKIDTETTVEGCQIVRHPFKVVQMKNFVNNDDDQNCTLGQLAQTINNIELIKKNNDLYSLKQSKDLSTYAEFGSVCHFFRDQVRSFLCSITGLPLNEHVALTISKYDQHDYLLCHDDQLDNRKIAFILYLVDTSWCAQDGGQLELFRCQSDNHMPLEVVHRLNPEWNLFNFFEVQPISYHQVSEVTTDRSPRWSINGWFHVDSVAVVPRNYSFPIFSQIRAANEYDDINYDLIKQWLNPAYFCDDAYLADIQKLFEDNSEIRLFDFLRPEIYQELANALRTVENERTWSRNHSPVFSKFEYIPEEWLLQNDETQNESKKSIASSSSTKVTNIIRNAFKLFTSEAFFILIGNFVGIKMHPLCVNFDFDNVDDDDETAATSASSQPELKSSNDSNDSFQSTCRGELRRWQHGDYSLVSNLTREHIEVAAIDVMFFLNVGSDTSSKVVNDAATTAKTTNMVDGDSKDDSDDEKDQDDEEDDDDDIGSDMSELAKQAGGYVTYIQDDEDDELLCIEPKSNSLNIVYRLAGTQRFMKYINTSNVTVPFHEFSFVYYPPLDQISKSYSDSNESNSDDSHDDDDESES